MGEIIEKNETIFKSFEEVYKARYEGIKKNIEELLKYDVEGGRLAHALSSDDIFGELNKLYRDVEDGKVPGCEIKKDKRTYIDKNSHEKKESDNEGFCYLKKGEQILIVKYEKNQSSEVISIPENSKEDPNNGFLFPMGGKNYIFMRILQSGNKFYCTSDSDYYKNRYGSGTSNPFQNSLKQLYLQTVVCVSGAESDVKNTGLDPTVNMICPEIFKKSIFANQSYYQTPIWETNKIQLTLRVNQKTDDDSQLLKEIIQSNTSNHDKYAKISVVLDVLGKIDSSVQDRYIQGLKYLGISNDMVDNNADYVELQGLIGASGDGPYSIHIDKNRLVNDIPTPGLILDINSYVGAESKEKKVVEDTTRAIFYFKAIYDFVTSVTENNKDEKKEYLFQRLRVLKTYFEPGIVEQMIEEEIAKGAKQIVLTGAPGTGKTYSTLQYVKKQIVEEYEQDNGVVPNEKTLDDKWKYLEKKEKGYLDRRFRFVQFHPSYDYTDFVEGLRPAPVDGKKTSFVRMDGSFKKFCRDVAEENQEIQKKRDQNIEAPIHFRYFVIDEINRADLSKVFGELMYCLEESYRGQKNAIPTQFKNLPTYEMKKEGTKEVANPLGTDVFEKGFYIPENVVIIGTMNDIDRSVDTFDFALRRRFKWVKVNVDEKLLKTAFLKMKDNNHSSVQDSKIDEICNKVMEMNTNLETGIASKKQLLVTPEDYYVGPAYFKSLFGEKKTDNEVDGELKAIYRNKIAPLLKEYFRGRDERDKITQDCGKLLTNNEYTLEEKGDFPEDKGDVLGAIDNSINSGSRQIVLTGAPGTGKTWSAKKYVVYAFKDEWKKLKDKLIEIRVDPEMDPEKNPEEAFEALRKLGKCEFVQFHPSFDYTDFVEGLRPANVEGDSEPSFVRMDGLFKEFCRKVQEEKKPAGDHRFFIIDEINRADLSKVFGELMFCLEEDYRGEDNGIETQYSNLENYKIENKIAKGMGDDEIYRKSFFIPENVIIIGTMNDIDRSVETFDFALRRRFKWINIRVTQALLENAFKGMKIDEKNATAVMKMNQAISDNAEEVNLTSPEDYYVGPAYFKGLAEGDTLMSIFDNKVKPLLREYVRGQGAEGVSDFIKKCGNALQEKA